MNDKCVCGLGDPKMCAVHNPEAEGYTNDSLPDSIKELRALREWIKDGDGYNRDDAPDEIARAIDNRIRQLLRSL